TLYHEKSIQKYIKDKYYGTKVNVAKPLSYIEK
ncbi:MAG: metal ABC transporter substrate-binding protein, partial [Liquorilactobacillus satsumensis]